LRDVLEDPRLVQLRDTLEGHAPRLAPRAAGSKEAAVALVLRPRERLELLLIKRAEVHGDPWSGHVALPGGRRGTGDADLVDTARRETEEEVGVPLARVSTLLGVLDDVAPMTPRLPPIVITPFVFAVPAATVAHPDAREVQAALWVPLDALRETSAFAEITVTVATGDEMTVPSFVIGDYAIWGLTYRILQQFLELV
jgi:8-oxo-dGTP pyrophosphatase MutT (NUDIX family)